MVADVEVHLKQDSKHGRDNDQWSIVSCKSEVFEVQGLDQAKKDLPVIQNSRYLA
jgi:hypothetical protein